MYKLDRKIVSWSSFILALAIVGPVIINQAYKIGAQMEKPLIVTAWEAADVLDYYGTILGALISVIILRITILSERETKTFERLREIMPKRLEAAEEAFNTLVDTMHELAEIFVPDILHTEDIEKYGESEIHLKLLDCSQLMVLLEKSSLNVTELWEVYLEMVNYTSKVQKLYSDLNPFKEKSKDESTVTKYDGCSLEIHKRRLQLEYDQIKNKLNRCFRNLERDIEVGGTLPDT